MNANFFSQKINMNNLSSNILESFESGSPGLNQNLFQTLIEIYQLNQNEILNISKLTQVAFIFDIFRLAHGI